MGRQFLGSSPDAVELHFYGALSQTYKGHLSDSAAVAGLIGMEEDSSEIGESLAIACNQGITIEYVTEPESNRNPNTVDMRLRKGNKTLKVAGISTGGGEILMTELDDFPLRLYGNEDALLFVSKRVFGEKELSDLIGPNFLKLETAFANGCTLHTCLLKNAPSEAEMEKIACRTEVLRTFLIASIYDYKLNDSTPLFGDIAGLLTLCENREASVPDMAVAFEEKRSGLDREGVNARIARIWNVMVRSVEEGLKGDNRLLAGFMPGNDAMKLMKTVREGTNVGGSVLGTAVARAIAAMEFNGCMGCISAAPTAGSCGVMPGAVLTVAENLGATVAQIHESLLAGAIMGVLIAMRAPVSGALGGCQSEIGVASAMTAASLAQLAGGTPRQIAHATTLALKNILGLICDPVAGPVEVPCIKRNAVGVANALAAADMALAGIESVIPHDEVIDALVNVQKLLPTDLRGTLKGGLASTPTAQSLKERWDALLLEK
jgi:L-serine dehydratase